MDWRALIFEHTFDTVSGTLEYSLTLNPAFENFCGQAWDRTTFRPLHGPITPTYYQNRVSSLQAASGIFKNFTLRADSSRTLKFILTDDPAGVFTIAFDYKTNQWLENAGAYSTEISSDSQSPVFDAGLFELGVRWRTLEAMGRPYGDAYAEYVERRDNKFAQDGNAEILDLAPKMFVLPGAENVPETGFGS